MSSNLHPDSESVFTAASTNEHTALLPGISAITPVLGDQEQPADQHLEKRISRLATCVIIICVTCVTGISSLLGGVVIVAIPSIAEDLELDRSIILWPASIYALTCACTLLLAGSIADVVGGRFMYVTGCFLQSLLSMACGLAKDGTQMIVFRAFAGVSASFILPSAVSVINNSFPPGRRRSWAFACMGGGQPIGFGLGLTLGGLMTGSIGWRWAFHTAAIASFLVFCLAVIQLPVDRGAPPISLKRFLSDPDWVGAAIASLSLGLLTYVMAVFTDSISAIHSKMNLVLIVFGLCLIPIFLYWTGRQERLGRPALIPISIWRNQVFCSICFSVFMVWASHNAFEQLLNFFFQEVQGQGPITAALEFLPAAIAGVSASIVMGFVIARARADIAIAIGCVAAAISPILMVIVDPSWKYWACAFPAILLNPLGADALFTIASLVITSAFPPETQGLAGGVFHTISQVGKSVGIALVTLIAENATANSSHDEPRGPEALMDGYRAGFWFCFALYLPALFATFWGLRKIGKVGSNKA